MAVNGIPDVFDFIRAFSEGTQLKRQRESDEREKELLTLRLKSIKASDALAQAQETREQEQFDLGVEEITRNAQFQQFNMLQGTEATGIPAIGGGTVSGTGGLADLMPSLQAGFPVRRHDPIQFGGVGGAPPFEATPKSGSELEFANIRDQQRASLESTQQALQNAKIEVAKQLAIDRGKEPGRVAAGKRGEASAISSADRKEKAAIAAAERDKEAATTASDRKRRADAERDIFRVLTRKGEDGLSGDADEFEGDPVSRQDRIAITVTNAIEKSMGDPPEGLPPFIKSPFGDGEGNTPDEETISIYQQKAMVDIIPLVTANRLTQEHFDALVLMLANKWMIANGWDPPRVGIGDF